MSIHASHNSFLLRQNNMFSLAYNTDFWKVINQYSYPNVSVATFHKYINGDAAIINKHYALVLTSPHLTFQNIIRAIQTKNIDVITKVLDWFYSSKKGIEMVKNKKCICSYISNFPRSIQTLLHIYRNYCTCKKINAYIFVELIFEEGDYNMVHEFPELYRILTDVMTTTTTTKTSSPITSIEYVIRGIRNVRTPLKNSTFELIKWYHEHFGEYLQLHDRDLQQKFIQACIIRCVKTLDVENFEWIIRTFDEDHFENIPFDHIDFFRQDVESENSKILKILEKYRSIRQMKKIDIRNFVLADLNNVAKWIVSKNPKTFVCTPMSLWIFLANRKYEILEFIYKHNSKKINILMNLPFQYLTKNPFHHNANDAEITKMIVIICTKPEPWDWLLQHNIIQPEDKPRILKCFHEIRPIITNSCITYAVETANITFLRYALHHFPSIASINKKRILAYLLGLADPKKKLSDTCHWITFLCRYFDYCLSRDYPQNPNYHMLNTNTTYPKFIPKNIDNPKMTLPHNRQNFMQLINFYYKRYDMVITDFSHDGKEQ